MSTTSPSEEDLKRALIALRADNPTLGISKLHALLLSTYPSWTVSEKRTRKTLQNEGLVLSSNKEYTLSGSRSQSGILFPKSRLMEGLQVDKWSRKVEVKFFDNRKGKGLVTNTKIAEGEVVWKEEPFVLAPEWELYDLQLSSVACAHCSTPLSGSTLAPTCQGSTSSPPCPAKFCNRLCLNRSGKTHPLLCPSRNPASAPLLAFARQNQWMALHALSQSTARILLGSQQQDDSTFRADWGVVRSFAQLGMEERAKCGWLGDAEPDRATWKKAHQLYTQAFRDPTTEAEKKKLSRLLKKPIPKEVADDIFSYDAFLWGLGRMSLNLEAHGGLYVLHSHLNHSCSPNVSIRHLEQRTALARISVIAKRDLEPGEELLITYVNPTLPLEQRRRQLLEWGFGKCQCLRCLEEENDPSRVSAGKESTDLENELKAGLGVL